MNKMLLGALIILLSGCATTVVPPSAAISAPSDRVYKFQSYIDNSGKLIVVRDQGMVGGGCYATIYINGERVAKLDTKEKATFNIPVGEWAVGTNLEGKGLCDYSGERQERFITIKANETKAVRIFTDGDGNMDIRPTTLN
ncbi:hypothetical protein C0X82_000856 [Escherichia coli O53]|nr:hypothetical protein [Escherichia coli O53]